MHKNIVTRKKSTYWHQVASRIEKEEARKARRDKIKSCDYSVTLPLSLRDRVAQIIPYEFEEYDRNVFIDDSHLVDTHFSKDFFKDLSSDSEDDENEEAKKEKKMKTEKDEEDEANELDFAESKCSDIERLENEFAKFDLKLDNPIELKVKKKKKVNWCSTYLCKRRKERIKWDSKIYQLDEKMADKTLDEQADVLIEAAAERFSNWLNTLGVNRSTDISKETLKALFSVEIDRMLLASLINDPKELKAIAKTVADVWNLPHMALELKYEDYIKQRLKGVPKRVQIVQFGRTVPTVLRPWVPTAQDDKIRTVFPDDILSGENLFKGIKHLRSTKALIHFYNKHPNVTAPSYFKKRRGSTYGQGHIFQANVPLYDKLKLVY